MAEVPRLVLGFLEALLEPIDPSGATWQTVMDKASSLVAVSKKTPDPEKN